MPTNSDECESPEVTFCKARLLLGDILSSADIIEELQGDSGRPDTKLVYGQAPTLMMLILQRLGGGETLKAAVKAVQEHHRDLLPQNRRVVEQTLSTSSASGYNKARKRISLATVKRFSEMVCNRLAVTAEAAFLDYRVFVLDGTTLTLPPTPELKKAFPPATNQLGQSVWPLAMLMVAHEMQTGCAMLPQIDPMHGPNNTSESRQAIHIIEQLPAQSLVLADAGFGIFSVAYHCHLNHQRFLLRLSKQRFHCHVKSAELVEESPSHRTYQLRWLPSAWELKANPQIPKNVSIEVFVHQVTLPNGQTLELISDLEADALSISQLYQRRYDVEFDIRDLKVTMDTENIRAKSVDTVMKELWGSILAYNLVQQFRRQAAKLVRIQPRQLSFTGVWLVFRYQLLQKTVDNLQQGMEIYTNALIQASRERLPQRKTPRNCPRKAHPRRQKSTKFQRAQTKAKKKQANQAPNEPPN